MTIEQIDQYLQWNRAIKDYDVMYQNLLLSSRDVMSRWMSDINGQFISQIGISVERMNSMQFDETSDCALQFRADAGSEIQAIATRVRSDFELIQGDFVYLLLDVIDQYVSFNQKWAMSVWNSSNMVTETQVIINLMETYIYQFYKSLFEAQIEEIIIEMQFFEERINLSRTTAFVALNNVAESFERNLLTC